MILLFTIMAALVACEPDFRAEACPVQLPAALPELVLHPERRVPPADEI